MVYPAGIALAQYRFSLQDSGTEEDIAEFGIHWQTTTEAPPDDWDTWLLALATASYAHWAANAIASEYRTNVILSEVIARGFDTSMHTLAEQTYSAGTLWHGTSTETCLPWQNSYVVGIYAYEPGTFSPNAKNKRGRVFLPPMHTGVIDDPANASLEPETATALIAQVQNTIEGVLEDMTDPSAKCVILSRATQATHQAQWVRGQTLIDTQRRRMHQIPRATVMQLLA